MVDQVKVAAVEQEPTEQSLRRNLTNRHIQLIAIGGAIGTGLFMGSGKTISLAGPSIIFVYMIIGFMLFFVMRAMGELLLSNLEYKSFSDFAADLLGPWAGYFTGWTYWFCWVVTGMADVVAITAYAQFWVSRTLRLGRLAGGDPAAAGPETWPPSKCLAKWSSGSR
ncbi:D-serine/D-alanine/glycine transporter [Klebsiella pneumoniae]|uniref:D-serine/D-alanine/glycine transporter n=1 Tax=Klebsiella pneumoniae TaxID=573 RepID=A0A377WDY4_KLEPN|nr:D-serine/D-alanine/glycine transporter [Klebsiella pneumoniae]